MVITRSNLDIWNMFVDRFGPSNYGTDFYEIRYWERCAINNRDFNFGLYR
jgi:hypothetical protein